MKTICFVNQKGGVGKTASVVNVGAGLAKLGKRVLLIDLDPQESLSYWVGLSEPELTVYDVFEGNISVGQAKISHPGGFDVVAANEMLATLQPDVDVIKQALQGQSYDYVLLDCSPTLGMTTLAALTAADWVIIPLCPDLLSIKGMSQLLGTISTIQEQTNSDLVLKCIIATRFCGRKRMHQEVLDQIGSFFEDVPIYTVRENIAVAESPVAGQSVLDYKPKSSGAQDYLAIARELLNG